MLGRLAHKLRLLGYDTSYPQEAGDDELLRKAVVEARILLTRDTRLMERRSIARGAVRAVFIENDRYPEQLEELRGAGVIERRPVGDSTRCSLCNEPLASASRNEAADAGVPTYVIETQARFMRCPVCGRFYWHGTHVEHYERDLDPDRPENVL